MYRARDKIAGMLEIIELLIHCFVTLIKLLKPGGVKLVMAESVVMKHQLIVMNVPGRDHLRLSQEIYSCLAY